ncbi:hypothetical protein Acor_02370 [Acrocarpospora corrugata]|uniref:Uncharacterized protein n=1 Tax=Acrocarpospora corrugata TaxID=35763 RepID=A0A5M3VNE1_9ACTN|nr:hypothetical protein [Acrocarpospora corrugata]GER98175.1 hypothetical protein Acor_02370 [Acrocarpospora corrugata]
MVRSGPTLSKRNLILAQTSDLCDANHAATYLGLLAFTENKGPDGNGRVVTTGEEARAVARRIRPMLLARGMAAQELHPLYFVDEGRQWPLIVLYEHQFLAYQVGAVQRNEAWIETGCCCTPARAI